MTQGLPPAPAPVTAPADELAQAQPGERLRIMLVAGEPSGDALGAELMAALPAQLGMRPEVIGVGGARMQAQGLASLFPMSDIAVMGPGEVLPRLPRILRRMRETAALAVDAQPHAVVIIDSPDFTHAVARRIHKQAPHLPIINYVSPQVWAWRQGRAVRMAEYLDHVLALLPFEPEFYADKGGPACTFVGHPVLQRVQTGGGAAFRARHNIPAEAPVLALLPGSRPNEVKRLIDIFLETAHRLRARLPGLVVVLPTVPNVARLVHGRIAGASLPLIVVEDEAEKFAAFDAADAALAASGTVSLELGLARVPTVIGYRIDWLTAAIVRGLLNVSSIVLANLVLGRNVVPEFLQGRCTPGNLADALEPLMTDTAQRRETLAALAEIPQRLGAGDGATPAMRAAEVVARIAREEAARRARG